MGVCIKIITLVLISYVLLPFPPSAPPSIFFQLGLGLASSWFAYGVFGMKLRGETVANM